MWNRTGSKQSISDMIRSRQSTMCNCRKKFNAPNFVMWLEHHHGGPDIEQGTESKETIIYPCFIIKYLIDLGERHFANLNHFLRFMIMEILQKCCSETKMLLRKILLHLVEVIRTYNKHILSSITR